MAKIALAIHGGAGTILRSTMTPELEREYRGGLEDALNEGWNILSKGGTSLDAVEAAVCSLEDFHLFNAGRGSVFTHEGKNEMDASIMDGRKHDAGAVAFVKNVKNPIKLARFVMERTSHILLAGPGANEFAREMNVEFADDAYFYTEHRYEQLLKAREQGVIELDHTSDEAGLLANSEGSNGDRSASPMNSVLSRGEDDQSAEFAEKSEQSHIGNQQSKGTVGAVACDKNGDLAAATSTGGMTNKKFGRVGDTAIIGAGTYADNATCAVSCTGYGEFFMIGVTAYDIAARMKFQGIDLDSSAQGALDHLTKLGGDGGFIAVDAEGNVVLPFNCEGMYRAFRTEEATAVNIYRD